MNYNAVEIALRTRFNTWLDALPSDICAYMRANTFIAGGAIASLIQDETPVDYDFFFVTPEAIKRIESLYNFGFLTPNAIAIGSNQFITRRFGPPALLTAQFDWMHTTGYFHLDELHLSPTMHEAAQMKKLLYNPTCLHPFHALYRIPKFLRRGYTVDRDELLALAEGLQRASLSDPDEVEGLYPYDTVV